MSKTEKTFIGAVSTPSFDDSMKRFVEPAVRIETFNEVDVILVSDNGFNGQHLYDPNAIWED